MKKSVKFCEETLIQKLQNVLQAISKGSKGDNLLISQTVHYFLTFGQNFEGIRPQTPNVGAYNAPP